MGFMGLGYLDQDNSERTGSSFSGWAESTDERFEVGVLFDLTVAG
jgi:hypothetical protein